MFDIFFTRFVRGLLLAGYLGVNIWISFVLSKAFILLRVVDQMFVLKLKWYQRF